MVHYCALKEIKNILMMKLALHWQIAIGMTLGALIGISLNIYGGTRKTVVQEDKLPTTLTSLEIYDSDRKRKECGVKE